MAFKQPGLRGGIPAYSNGLELDHLKGPLQPKPFYKPITESNTTQQVRTQQIKANSQEDGRERATSELVERDAGTEAPHPIARAPAKRRAHPCSRSQLLGTRQDAMPEPGAHRQNPRARPRAPHRRPSRPNGRRRPGLPPTRQVVGPLVQDSLHRSEPRSGPHPPDPPRGKAGAATEIKLGSSLIPAAAPCAEAEPPGPARPDPARLSPDAARTAAAPAAPPARWGAPRFPCALPRPLHFLGPPTREGGSAPPPAAAVPRRLSAMSPGLSLILAALVLLAASERAEGSAAEEEVKIEVLHLPESCSPKSKKGDLLNAHYDGFLASNGSKFYCSRTQNDGHPKWFVLGVGQVIKGLDIAMMNMCPGEKRKVVIPPSLAYGQQGYEQGKIPPNATLIFEIELYAVNKGPRSVEAFRQIDKDNDKKLSELEISEYLKEEFARDGKKRHPSVHDEILADIFKKNDHDGDGFISAKEYNVYQHDEL
ncbi:peptidyl-prolyl cis-trans isomerase FKBP7 [Coturnix japonica]|uniref:peptidyl-prolyl cis-trans isomerase FKBP7 n=1 Tax=Coturnix japonica TaxID=93934 RepID=UPI000776C538|nr:peptidyl-prolyl cis-trans isomerase FKBP7 [Coturnix japonica]